jgi:lon-related putative ATP-dependent protease
MEPGKALKAEELYRPCELEGLTFETTAEIGEPSGFFGQTRAVEAIQFGAEVDRTGYNLFVLGPPGTGRHSFVREFLEAKALTEPVPSDWCYVNNFADSRRAVALELPAGTGRKLREDIEQLIKEAQRAIPAALESEDYRNRRQAIEEEAQREQEEAFKEVDKHAQEKGLGFIQTSTGFAFVPLIDGQKVELDEYRKLPEEERKRLERETQAVGKELREKLQAIPRKIRKLLRKIQKLDEEVILFSVSSLIEEVIEDYEPLPQVVEHLRLLENDIVANIHLFRQPSETQGLVERVLSQQMGSMETPDSPGLRRYAVNVFVDHSESRGAPVVFEEYPAYQQLIGRIEHIAKMGTLVTDFNLLEAGALHRANGGYLVVDARKVLLQPFAWEALKRALKLSEIRIRSLGHLYSLVDTVSLEPQAIPLRAKVVLVGDRLTYYLLQALDPEFPDLFKVAADFDDQMDRSPENVKLMACFLAGLGKDNGLLPLDRTGVARIVEESSRIAGDSLRLSTQMRKVVDLVREADFWSRKAGKEVATGLEVQRAIDARTRRASRVRDRIREEILRGTILVDTSGMKIGQTNGLAVLQIGDYSFARPHRISARVSLGSGEVVDIEREVELGGPIHSKGVLILSNFLASNYVNDRPLSLSASLVFEQSYGSVEGDSASAAELSALLSALSDLPIAQSLAVTGSVNQYGEVQAIGGVNEKIEGFFDICEARGLRGDQGVLIPSANVQHLMLRADVIEAVKAGQFNIYPVEDIDQCMELLTGARAGERDESGEFPEGTVNRKLCDRLIDLADKRRDFAPESKGPAPL